MLNRFKKIKYQFLLVYVIIEIVKNLEVFSNRAEDNQNGSRLKENLSRQLSRQVAPERVEWRQIVAIAEGAASWLNQIFSPSTKSIRNILISKRGI